MGMMSYEEAFARLVAAAPAPFCTETVPTLYAEGRILAKDVVSAIDVPFADNSQMDGYAIRREDIREFPAVLPVTQRIPAGHASDKPLQPGTCARIFTGAVMPEGADTIVPQEDTEALPNAVRIRKAGPKGTFVRPAGKDIRKGGVVLTAGSRMTPAAMGVVSSVGQADVDVYTRMRVAIFFTGDELVRPGEPIRVGQVYNSNRYLLRGMLKVLGCDVIDLGIVGDTVEQTVDAFRRAAEGADLIITSGGMSVGEEDHVRTAVNLLGQVDVWRLRVKPGKPFAWGRVGDVPFLGIPGNPAATFVSFLTLVRPFILRMQGFSGELLRPRQGIANFDWLKGGDREEFLRTRWNGQGALDLYPAQNSQLLMSCAWADCLVDVPAGSVIHKGDAVKYYSVPEFFL